MNAGTLEFLIKIRDMASTGLAKVSANAQSAYNKMRNGMDRVQQKNKVLAMSYSEIGRAISAVEQRISNSKTVQEIRAARQELEKLQNTRSKMDKQTGAKGGGLLGGLGSLVPALGVAGAVAFGGASFGQAMKADSNKSAINFATGGQGDEAIKQLKAINDEYGLSNTAGIEGFKQLSGAVMSMNMPLNKTLDLYKSVGAASAAMKLDGEKQEGIFLALGQMASKGTVSAEELRGQMSERLPGAFGVAAKAMGVTEAELGKMMDRGEVAAKDFLPRFAAQLQKTFGAEALKQANSPQATMQKFYNKINDITVAIGTALIPILTSLASAFMTVANWVQVNWDWLSAILVPLAVLVGTYQTIVFVTEAWAAAQLMLNAAMNLNPIFLIISLIAALIAGIAYAIYKFETFRKVVYGLWSAFKQVFNNIGNYFKEVFSPISKAIEYFKKGEYGAAAKEVGKLAFNLTPVGLAMKAYEFNKKGGFTKGISEAYDKEALRGIEKAAVEKKKTSSTVMAKSSAPSLSAATATTKTSSTDTVSGSITGGGARVIHINGVRFADKIEFHVADMKEGAEQALATFEDMFLRVLNSGAALE